MAEKSNIPYTDHTSNPWIGCTPISPGCKNCYADVMDNQRKWTPEGFGKGKPRYRTKSWAKPKNWNKQSWLECDNCGWRGDHKDCHDGMRSACPECAGISFKATNQRVFPSLLDPFDEEIPVEWRQDFGKLILETPELDWLLLTKRIENVSAMLGDYGNFGSDNVWLGTSVENQKLANQRIPELLKIRDAHLLFLSIEPLLGPIDFAQLDISKDVKTTIAWVIVGGESGSKARAMHPDWVRTIQEQCAGSNTPFFFKQWGEWKPLHPQYGHTDSHDRFDDLEAHPNRDHGYREVLCKGNDGTIYAHYKNEKVVYWCGYQPDPATNPWWFGKAKKETNGAVLDGKEYKAMPLGK